MSIEVETRSRARFFPRGVRRLLNTSGPQRSSDAAALISTSTSASPVHAMFQDARNTNIGCATFNIYGSSTRATTSSSESTNPQQPPSGPAITETSANSTLTMSCGSELVDNPIPTPQTSPEIYVRHLITKNRGYPLWIPSPNMRLPTSYRASGVKIGDVGVITPEGGFSFLFNVFHAATHPVNASMRLPNDFFPFAHDSEFSSCDVDEFKESSAGGYLADESLVRMDEDDDRFKTVLKTSAAHAAVLMTPEPVYASKLQSTVLLRKYVRDNIKSWYRFSRTVLGREVDNGDLRVVYGCRKSAAFGIATVSNLTRLSGSGSAENVSATELTFSIDDSWTEVTGCRYRWHHRGSAEVKVGPSLDEHRDIQRERGMTGSTNLQSEPVINQCLFVSTIDFTLPANEWQHIEREDSVSVTTSQCPSSQSASTSPSSTQSASSDGHQSNFINSPVTGSGQNEGIDSFHPQDICLHDSLNWPSITPSKRLFNPSDILAQFLLRMVPQATSVALCSDDWGPHMTDSVQTVAALINNVLSANDISEDNGMVYLSPKKRTLATSYLDTMNCIAVSELSAEHDTYPIVSLASWAVQNIVAILPAAEHSVRLGMMLTKTPPPTLRPSCISIKFSDFVACLNGLLAGRSHLGFLSKIEIFFLRRYDGHYTVYVDVNPRENFLALGIARTAMLRNFSFNLSSLSLSKLERRISSDMGNMILGVAESYSTSYSVLANNAISPRSIEEQEDTAPPVDDDDAEIIRDHEDLGSHTDEWTGPWKIPIVKNEKDASTGNGAQEDDCNLPYITLPEEETAGTNQVEPSNDKGFDSPNSSAPDAGVHTFMGEVHKHREERHAPQQEHGSLLSIKTEYEPSSEYDSDRRPTLPQPPPTSEFNQMPNDSSMENFFVAKSSGRKVPASRKQTKNAQERQQEQEQPSFTTTLAHRPSGFTSPSAGHDYKMRKRDMIKHGLGKATSKLGLSSHAQTGYLYDAIAPSVTNSLAVIPTVSQAHKEAFYPTPPPTQGVVNQEETRYVYRASPTPGSTGDKNHAFSSRLSSVPLPKKKIHDDKKNSNKLHDSKTGGIQSRNQ